MEKQPDKKEKQIKLKRIKKLKSYSNDIIIKYDPGNIWVNFD